MQLKDYEYFKTDRGILYKGNCEEIIPLIQENVTLTLTDYPYNEVNRKSNGLRQLDKGGADVMDIDLSKITNMIINITTGSVYTFCGTKQISDILKVMSDNNMSTRVIVWEKPNPSPMNGKHIWLSGVELCAYGKKPNATYNGFCEKNILRFNIERGIDHTTPKPIGMFEKIIQMSSNENDTIFDPFMGSGTTALACEKLNRNWIGIEIDETYCKYIRQRVETYTAQPNLF